MRLASLVPASGAPAFARRPVQTLWLGYRHHLDPPAALARYEKVRLPRASQVQEASRGRIPHHHLPDGPEQLARDAAFAGDDPLTHNDWIYAHDAEQTAPAAAPAKSSPPGKAT